MRVGILAAAVAASLLAGTAHASNEEAFRLELNKFEPVDGACRIYFVLRNNGDSPVDSYKPDLVFFDRNGVIASRLVVEGGPLPAHKTRVKLFDVKDLECADIGSVLLNDVSGCVAPDGGSCLKSTGLASRAPAELTK